MKTWKPGASSNTLRKRATLLGNIRRFFEQREILEVETPSISQFPTLDLHLESLSLTHGPNNLPSYLITSPEYHMKRLLADNGESIYQICKAFRLDEAGLIHNPEFTIIEWYRVGWDQWQLMREIEELLGLVLETGDADRLSYQEVFKDLLGIDPISMVFDEFLNICSVKDLVVPEYLKNRDLSVDEWLNYLFGMLIEPRLGKTNPVFIYDYPASQANLAKIYPDNSDFSMRFELFYKGMELGNGFCELTDPGIQEDRFINENIRRKKSGKKELPIDHRLLSALRSGLPDCAGVALGFDRMVMLALGKNRIDEVTAFSWNRC